MRYSSESQLLANYLPGANRQTPTISAIQDQIHKVQKQLDKLANVFDVFMQGDNEADLLLKTKMDKIRKLEQFVLTLFDKNIETLLISASTQSMNLSSNINHTSDCQPIQDIYIAQMRKSEEVQSHIIKTQQLITGFQYQIHHARKELLRESRRGRADLPASDTLRNQVKGEMEKCQTKFNRIMEHTIGKLEAKMQKLRELDITMNQQLKFVVQSRIATLESSAFDQ